MSLFSSKTKECSSFHFKESLLHYSEGRHLGNVVRLRIVFSRISERVLSMSVCDMEKNKEKIKKNSWLRFFHQQIVFQCIIDFVTGKCENSDYLYAKYESRGRINLFFLNRISSKCIAETLHAFVFNIIGFEMSEVNA